MWGQNARQIAIGVGFLLCAAAVVVVLTAPKSGFVGFASGSDGEGCGGSPEARISDDFPGIFDGLTDADFRTEHPHVAESVRSLSLLKTPQAHTVPAWALAGSDLDAIEAVRNVTDVVQRISATAERLRDWRSDAPGSALGQLRVWNALIDKEWDCFELATQAGGEWYCRASTRGEIWAEVSFVEDGTRVAVVTSGETRPILRFTGVIHNDGTQWFLRFFRNGEHLAAVVYGSASDDGWSWTGIDGERLSWRLLEWPRNCKKTDCDMGFVRWDAEKIDRDLPIGLQVEGSPEQSLKGFAQELQTDDAVVEVHVVD